MMLKIIDFWNSNQKNNIRLLIHYFNIYILF